MSNRFGGDIYFQEEPFEDDEERGWYYVLHSKHGNDHIGPFDTYAEAQRAMSKGEKSAKQQSP